MKILEDYTFFTNTTSSGTSESFKNACCGQHLILEVTGDNTVVDITVNATVKNITTTPFPVAITKLSDKTIVSTITSNGLYMVDIGGLTNITCEIANDLTNAVNVYGKIVG